MSETEAKLEGYFECSQILFDAIRRLKTSLNDYAAIEYQEFIPSKSEDRTTFAHNTLTVLEDLFLEEYDRKIEPMKWELEREQ